VPGGVALASHPVIEIGVEKLRKGIESSHGSFRVAASTFTPQARKRSLALCNNSLVTVMYTKANVCRDDQGKLRDRGGAIVD
jgi:hypothetical protein